jgi:vacuolar-type H+-ATPase subunit I/STV1
MFATTEMSRLTVAAPVGKLEEVLRKCASLSCVHIEEYEHFQDGIGVGRALSSEGADKTSAMLTKVRAVTSAVQAINTKGPVAAKEAASMMESFGPKVDDALAYLETIRESESSISTLSEQLQVLERLAPLDIPLELMGGFDGLEVYVGETPRASKSKTVFAALGTEILLHSAPGVVAVACQSQHAAEVQICLAELGAKAVQIPSGEGSPAKKAAAVRDEMTTLENTIASSREALDAWVDRNARSLVALEEFLTREDAIYTAPTLVAVSDQAFALDGWVPTSQGDMVKAELGKIASHVAVDAYVDPHHGHGHDDHHDDAPTHAKELVMLSDYLLKTKQSVFQFFKSIDLDDSGKIDSYEFQQALKSSNIGNLPPWDIGPLVQALDLDGDGKINLPELDIALTMVRATPVQDDHHEVPAPPIEFDNGTATQPFELLVDLVGRPKYGTFEPSMLIMMTFPFMYGMILGDWGYGVVLLALSFWLGSKPFAVDPLAQKGMTVLRWMGVWCVIWGIIFAEGFGFVWDGSMYDTAGVLKDGYRWGPDIAILTSFYDWAHDVLVMPESLAVLLGLGDSSHPFVMMPFHRASAGHGLEQYVSLAVYLGVFHIFVGLIIGFKNVNKAHGLDAAFFEKGSWLMILIGGFMICRNFIMGYNELFEVQLLWNFLLIGGILCLIVGLAIYEGFGWAGGILMGPIETFGLLANTLSYLRIMAVGVAGVKIAEVSIIMGWENILVGLENGGASGYLTAALCFVIFMFVQVFALALGILSPTIHAARLHFVEWMGKFYDGSGRAFAPLGGRSLHVEGQS